jgi:hypothetical protein
MPPAQLNLYAGPQDLWDYLSTEAVDLRLDDHVLGTGQIIRTVANAAQGATSLGITALQYPLLPGTQLEFDGAGTAQVVQVTTTAVAAIGAITLPVQPIAAAINALAQASDSGVNVATGARLVKACNYGTSQVKLYCCGRYNDSDLANCWSANRWATVLGGRWLCKRRAQPCPKGIEEDWKEAKEELALIQQGRMQLEDVPLRTSGFPFISNVTIDIRYDYAKIRVEQPLSELTPTQYGQYIDWNAALWIEYF